MHKKMELFCCVMNHAKISYRYSTSQLRPEIAFMIKQYTDLHIEKKKNLVFDILYVY